MVGRPVKGAAFETAIFASSPFLSETNRPSGFCGVGRKRFRQRWIAGLQSSHQFGSVSVVLMRFKGELDEFVQEVLFGSRAPFSGSLSTEAMVRATGSKRRSDLSGQKGKC
jgi:hypothetical protein